MSSLRGCCQDRWAPALKAFEFLKFLDKPERYNEDISEALVGLSIIGCFSRTCRHRWFFVNNCQSCLLLPQVLFGRSREAAGRWDHLLVLERIAPLWTRGWRAMRQALSRIKSRTAFPLSSLMSKTTCHLSWLFWLFYKSSAGCYITNSSQCECLKKIPFIYSYNDYQALYI